MSAMQGPLRLMIGVGVVGAVVLVGLIVLPGSSTVTRTATIDAPPAEVYALVVDLEKYQAWSPWAAADGSLDVTYGAKRSGIGASYSWSGKDSGAGTLTIREAIPTSRIVNDLDFGGTSAVATWTFAPADGKTSVSWTVDTNATGPTSGFFAIMADDLIGPSLEDGLTRLGEHAKANP